MGLDMYLCKHIFVGANYEHRNVTGVIDISADGRRIPIDFKRVSCIVEQVGYWRKANQIHLRSDSTLPLSRLDIVDGEIVELPAPEPTEEWSSKEGFIEALSSLVSAADLAAMIATPEALKTGVAGLALLTTDAAPGGMIDLLDPRVSQWLQTFGLTLNQVRAQMEVTEV